MSDRALKVGSWHGTDQARCLLSSRYWGVSGHIADRLRPPPLTPSGHSPADGLPAQLPATWLYGEGRGKLTRTYPGGSFGHEARNTFHLAGRTSLIFRKAAWMKPVSFVS